MGLGEIFMLMRLSAFEYSCQALSSVMGSLLFALDPLTCSITRTHLQQPTHAPLRDNSGKNIVCCNSS
jgi:hypothetical protein